MFFFLNKKMSLRPSPHPALPPSPTLPNPIIKILYGIMILILSTSTGHLLSFMKLSRTVFKLRADRIFILKITNGHNSVKNVHGVTVLNLYTSSDNALYLNQVS